MMYHYGLGLVDVADFLGHEDIENTRLYIQTAKISFKDLPRDNFIIRTISNLRKQLS